MHAILSCWQFMLDLGNSSDKTISPQGPSSFWSYHTIFYSRWSLPSCHGNIDVRISTFPNASRTSRPCWLEKCKHSAAFFRIHMRHPTFMTWHMWLSTFIIWDLNQKETVRQTSKGHKKTGGDILFNFLAQCSYSCGFEARRPVSNPDCQLQLASSVLIQFEE